MTKEQVLQSVVNFLKTEDRNGDYDNCTIEDLPYLKSILIDWRFDDPNRKIYSRLIQDIEMYTK